MKLNSTKINTIKFAINFFLSNYDDFDLEELERLEIITKNNSLEDFLNFYQNFNIENNKLSEDNVNAISYMLRLLASNVDDLEIEKMLIEKNALSSEKNIRELEISFLGNFNY